MKVQDGLSHGLEALQVAVLLSLFSNLRLKISTKVVKQLVKLDFPKLVRRVAQQIFEFAVQDFEGFPEILVDSVRGALVF